MPHCFFDTKRRPPFGHGPFVLNPTVIFQHCPTFGKHFVFDHLLVLESEDSSLFEDYLDVTRRLWMNHLIRDVICEMSLQFRVPLEEGEMTLIRDTVQVVDFGDEAVPILPEDFDRFFGQGAISQLAVEASLDEPAVRQGQQCVP